MDNRFREIEQEFQQLKRKYRQNKISEREFKDSLKALRLKDGKGRYWTLGARTGKWYYYDKNRWIESHPPTLQSKRAVCITCGAENDLEVETCGVCGEGVGVEEAAVCPDCGALLNLSGECPSCEEESIPRKKDKGVNEEVPLPKENPSVYVLRSFQGLSVFFFFGTVGLFAGIVVGAFIGASVFFPEAASVMPLFLQELQGKLLGGILFGLLGGVAGFVAISVAGLALAAFSNMILLFVGGIRVKLEKAD